MFEGVGLVCGGLKVSGLGFRISHLGFVIGLAVSDVGFRV